MDKYTEEQKKDIEERTEKALKYLEELQLSPQAYVTKGIFTVKGPDGDDVQLFADRVQPVLKDLKYQDGANA